MNFTKKHMKWSMLVLLPFLAACASGPTQEQMVKANYGRDMSATQCESAVERVISRDLKDPSSAQFSHSPCYKGHWGSVPILGLGVEFGWVQDGAVNAKNAYGGYVGFRSYKALVRDGSVIRYCVSDKNGICMP